MIVLLRCSNREGVLAYSDGLHEREWRRVREKGKEMCVDERRIEKKGRVVFASCE